MLAPRAVHRSLLRPVRFLGIERELFFLGVAVSGPPILVAPVISLLLAGALLLFWALFYQAALWLTVRDSRTLSLFVASLGYSAYYGAGVPAGARIPGSIPTALPRRK
jgi:type IV secretory pathway TrbD component